MIGTGWVEQAFKVLNLKIVLSGSVETFLLSVHWPKISFRNNLANVTGGSGVVHMDILIHRL